MSHAPLHETTTKPQPLPASAPADWMFLQPGILDQMHDAIIVTDLNGVVTGCNRAATHIYGYAADELIGQNVTLLYPPEDAAHLTGTIIPSILQTGEFRGEIRNRTRSGDYVYIHLSISLLRGPDGLPAAMVGFSIDVTAQKLSQLVLAAQTDRIGKPHNSESNSLQIPSSLMLSTVEQAQDAILITEAVPIDDPGPTIRYINESFTRMTGYSASEILGRNPRFLQGPKTSRPALDRIRAALRTGQPVREELINYRKDGSEFIVDLSIFPVPGHPASPTHFISIQREITDQTASREALRLLARNLAEAHRIARLGNWEWDCTTDTVTWSQEIYRLFQRDLRLSPPTFAEQRDLFTQESMARLEPAVARCIQNGEPYELDLELRLSDGQSRWATARGEATAFRDGRATHLRGTIQDITPRKRIEQALQSSEGRFRDLAESIPQMVWVADANGKKVYCNQRYMEYTGLHTLEEIDQAWHKLLHAADHDATLERWLQSVRTGEPYLSEYQLRSRDGTYRYFLARAVAIRDADGNIDRWLGSSTDIHDQKLAEETLRRTEKLAAVGRLASTISHEITNPLAGVTNLLYLLSTNSSLDQTAREYLAAAEEQLARVTQVTTQALRFHRQSTGPTPLILSETLSTLLSLNLPHLRSKEIEVRRRYDNSPPLECLAGEVRQAFANILKNSIDALPPHGVLFVRVHQAVNPAAPSTKGIRVIIADHGCGIPREDLPRIFEPFFSTKGPSGTGLGLWVAKGIIERHAGRISVRSSTKPGNSGTVVSVFLPYSVDA